MPANRIEVGDAAPGDESPADIRPPCTQPPLPFVRAPESSAGTTPTLTPASGAAWIAAAGAGGGAA